MKPETYARIQKLARCNFAPATTEKRFVRCIATYKPEYELSEKQLMYLGSLLYRYRKQMEALPSDE